MDRDLLKEKFSEIVQKPGWVFADNKELIEKIQNNFHESCVTATSHGEVIIKFHKSAQNIVSGGVVFTEFLNVCMQAVKTAKTGEDASEFGPFPAQQFQVDYPKAR